VTGLREICQSKLQLKSVHGETLRTQDLNEQPVLGIKEFPRTGSCEPVESHHWNPCHRTIAWNEVWNKRISFYNTSQHSEYKQQKVYVS